MWQYLAIRLLLIVPTLVGVGVFIFLLMRVLPGDAVEIRYAREGGMVSEEALEKERERLGLNQPLWVQFIRWVEGIGRFDFGMSLRTGRPVLDEIAIRFEVSFQVAIMATLISVMMALPLGLIAAVYQDSWIDYVVRIFSIGGLAMPTFWFGILILLFLLNVFGFTPPALFTSIWENPAKNLSKLIWPALTVGYYFAAIAMRMTRSAVLEVFREDYARTARAKGLREWPLTLKHVLPNALLPIVTVIGLEFAFLLGGLIVTEQVFNLNGLGLLFVQSVAERDYATTQALVLLVSATFVAVNFLVDMLYAALDPRIKYA